MYTNVGTLQCKSLTVKKFDECPVIHQTFSYQPISFNVSPMKVLNSLSKFCLLKSPKVFPRQKYFALYDILTSTSMLLLLKLHRTYIIITVLNTQLKVLLDMIYLQLYGQGLAAKCCSNFSLCCKQWVIHLAPVPDHFISVKLYCNIYTYITSFYMQ